MAATTEHGATLPEALANTHAGRLLEAILTDPSLPHSAARAVPPRGARAANDVPAIARQTSPREAIPAAPTDAPVAAWTPEELEAAKVEAEHHDRRIGLRLVAGAVALVALAILLTLALPHGAEPVSPAVDASPAAAVTAEDEVLVVDEPFVVGAGDEEAATELEPLIVDHRAASAGD